MENREKLAEILVDFEAKRINGAKANRLIFDLFGVGVTSKFKDFVDKQQDLDEETIDIINKNFWELM